jgi:hypothetical protein
MPQGVCNTSVPTAVLKGGGRAIGDVDGPAPDIIPVYRLQGAAENSLEAE